MNRTMYDAIGANAHIVRDHWQPGNLAGYYSAGNSFIWTDAEKGLFPKDALVGITLTASYTGDGSDVLDVEPGGASPPETRGWIAAKKAKGYFRPTIYCSLSTVPAIRSATGNYILGIDYDLWIADWDGSTAIPYPHAAAKQFQNAGPYDVSVVYDDHWPHRTLVPPPPPPPMGTVISPQKTLTVPPGTDHVRVDAVAIVHSKEVPIATWRMPVV